MDKNINSALRRSYEIARLRYALWRALPVCVFVLIACWVGWSFANLSIGGPIAYGAGIFFLVVAMSWRGQDMGSAVTPGLVASTLPFAAAIGSSLLGHVCVGDSCVSLCRPMCAAAGVGAGAIVSFMVLRKERKRQWLTWLGAGILVVAIGNLACQCLGVGSLVGVIVGQLVGGAPAALWIKTRKTSEPS